MLYYIISIHNENGRGGNQFGCHKPEPYQFEYT